MNDSPEYKVRFGRDAWTIDYEDTLGEFTFVFDADISEYDAKGFTKRLLLQGGPPLKDMKVMECQTQADREHVALMLERVRQYLASLGYEVVVV
jgi:hypothetical protein